MDTYEVSQDDGSLLFAYRLSESMTMGPLWRHVEIS